PRITKGDLHRVGQGRRVGTWSIFRSGREAVAQSPPPHQSIEEPLMLRHSTRAIRHSASVWILAVACGGAGAAPGDAAPGDEATAPAPLDTITAAATVTPGLEVGLRDSTRLLRDRRVGCITIQTCVTSDGRSGIALLFEAEGVELVALYGPEHGLRGGVEGGVKIESGQDPETGVPIFSR